MTPSRPKFYNVQRNQNGVRQATVQLVVDQVARHKSRHNSLPSTMEVANELEFHPTTVRKAWQQAMEIGLLLYSPPRFSATEETKAKQASGCMQHTGRCRPETAQRIIDLLNNEPEARVLWTLMLSGASRGPAR